MIRMTDEQIEKNFKNKKSEILDELIKNKQFDLLKTLLSFGNKMNFDYLEVADKLLFHDLDEDKYIDEAFNTFIWLDLRQCDYENDKFNDGDDNLGLDTYLQDYVDLEKYDRVNDLLNMPKITFKKEDLCIGELFGLNQKGKITWKNEYDEYFGIESLSKSKEINILTTKIQKLEKEIKEIKCNIKYQKRLN